MPTSLEEILADLVAIPSISTNHTACRDSIMYVQKRLLAHGLHVSGDLTSDRPWIFATTRLTKKPDILLASHLDVVPGGIDLFTMQYRSDKLVGRGVYDMKFAAACYLEFIERHTDMLHTLNLGFLFTTDEEIGGDSIIDILKTGIHPKVVLLPDGGDDWYIESRAKGIYGVKLEAHGKTAHGSRPWEGDNAVERILDVCQAIRSDFPLGSHDGTTLSINGIDGGRTVNQIPDHATALIDIRSFDTNELARFDRRIHELAVASRVEVFFAQSGSPVIFQKNNPVVQRFLDAYQTILQAPPKYKDSFGTTDARHFASYSIPCIILEPYGGGRHAPNEWIKRESLDQYYQLIEAWLLNESALVSTNAAAISQAV